MSGRGKGARIILIFLQYMAHNHKSMFSDCYNRKAVVDKRLLATNNLCVIVSWLLNPNTVLEGCRQVLLDNKSTFLKKRQMTNSLW